jgi:hypothetical protein
LASQPAKVVHRSSESLRIEERRRTPPLDRSPLAVCGAGPTGYRCASATTRRRFGQSVDKFPENVEARTMGRRSTLRGTTRLAIGGPRASRNCWPPAVSNHFGRS